MTDRRLRPLVIAGPTAGGKSELAVALTQALTAIDGKQPHILSADSMQVYKHLDAGVAKPSRALRSRATHHLIDLIEPTQPFSVSDWLKLADALIEQLQADGIRPVIVGGANLYLKALLEGLFDGPGADVELRARLAKLESIELHAQLQRVDPESAGRIAVNDRKRLIRALEVHHATGKPISTWRQQWSDQPSRAYRHDPLLIGLRWPVETINQRINHRAKAMFYPEKVEAALAAEICPNGENLPDETARLEKAGLLGLQVREALGYAQVLQWINDPTDSFTLEDAFERTKIQTRRFAKSQRTWLKRFSQLHWLDADGASVELLVDRALAHVC